MTFASLNVSAGIEPFAQGPARRQLALTRRAGAPIHAGVNQGARTFTVTFQPKPGNSTESTLLALLGYLEPDNPDERTFVAELNDGTQVRCEAAIGTFRWANVNQIVVEFSASDPVWRELTATTASLTIDEATQYTFGAVALSNDGGARAWPTFKIGWTTQRTNTSATVGWKYRRQVTITNATDRDWRNEPVCLDLGDTAAWVTAVKAQSDGDDVRVRYQGEEFPRTLTNFNTKRTLCHVVLPLLKAGASMTLDVVYGNASATAPDNLSTRTGSGDTYVAFDLEGDNGTATGGSTTTLVDGGKSWETDRWAGAYLLLLAGTGSVRYRRIASNTSTTLTLNRALASAPDATTVYAIVTSGIMFDGGRVSSRTASTITDTGHTTKWVTNSLVGATVTFVGGSGATPSTMTVASNTSDTLTFTSSFSVQPAVNDSYLIERMGVWQYLVDTAHTETAHRGLYRINRYYSPPGRIAYGDSVPGGWQPTTYLPNSDDYSQLRAYNVGSGGGHSANYWPLLRARRRKSQDARYKDEGNGDGLSIYTAFGFQTITFDYQYKNVNGVGKIVFACLEPGGEDWATFVEQTTTQASLTPVAAQNVDLSAYDNPTRIFMGVLPADEVAVASSAAETDEVEVRTDNTLTLWLDADAFGGLTNGVYAVGSESSIYDLNVALRLGGGEESVKAPPYDRALTGGSGHYLRLKSGESLVINCDPLTSQPFAAVYSGATLQYRAPWAVRVYRHEADIEGVDTALVSRDFMPIPARTNLLSNPTFATNLTGWGNQEDDAGVTATWSRDAGVFYDAAGSLKCVVSAAPGVGYFSKYMTTSTIAVVTGQTYDVAFAFRTTNTNLQGWMAVDDGVTEYDLGYYVAAATGTWYVGGFSFTAPASAITFRVGVYGAAGATGTIYFDALSLGQQNLYISETSMGSLTVATAFYPGWWG